MKISAERHRKYIDLANFRQQNITVILENIFDTHNIGAILRSCDAIGISDVFILYTDPQLQGRDFVMGKRTTAGTRKWVQVHYFEDLDQCFTYVRSIYKKIYTTHLSDDGQSLYDMDLTQSCALLFGNEGSGVSVEALSKADGNFSIPQMGMVESLNVSVACAVTLFEGLRQRSEKGMYTQSEEVLPQARPIYDKYMDMHATKIREMPIINHVETDIKKHQD
ncbi:TrmH family RNA methyltransferase [Membranihabitans marinus]|uniref:TrmH family RNA methyltransferase n=1 Tax=Membranihabitans marinus TaxID=1227546 RepID=UPI001F380019|nr:RNA methyltransferase [Membranihabitans marinus]